VWPAQNVVATSVATSLQRAARNTQHCAACVVVQAAFAQRLARHTRRLARCAADPRWAEQLGGLPAALRSREQAGLGSRMRIVSRQAY
jgi:steroid 5-alpha reductase family enzyme